MTNGGFFLERDREIALGLITEIAKEYLMKNDQMVINQLKSKEKIWFAFFPLIMAAVT